MPPDLGINGGKKAPLTTTATVDTRTFTTNSCDNTRPQPQKQQQPPNNVQKVQTKPSSPPLPPDGGWGWVVVLSSFMISVLVDGVCFSAGIFFNPFKAYYGATKAETAWVGSVLNGSYLSVGPLVSACVNRYGCRRVAMFGSVFASIAFFLSTFSPTMPMLIVTYGMLGGIGFGFVYLPAIVMVGYYFEKRRALATGIACCGSGIGAFLFAPICNILLETYGDWKGATWILSGLVLNGLVFSIFYRPLENGPGAPAREISMEGGESEEREALLKNMNLKDLSSMSKDADNHTVSNGESVHGGKGKKERGEEKTDRKSDEGKKALLSTQKQGAKEDPQDTNGEISQQTAEEFAGVDTKGETTTTEGSEFQHEHQLRSATDLIRPPPPEPVDRPAIPITGELSPDSSIPLPPLPSVFPNPSSSPPLSPTLATPTAIEIPASAFSGNTSRTPRAVLVGSTTSSCGESETKLNIPAVMITPVSQSSSPPRTQHDKALPLEVPPAPVVVTDVNVELIDDRSVKSSSTKSRPGGKDYREDLLGARQEQKDAIPAMIKDLIQTVTPEIQQPQTSQVKSFLSDMQLTVPTPVARMAFSQDVLTGPSGMRKRMTAGPHQEPHRRHHHSSHLQVNNPLQRKDIFYSGSLQNLPEFASSGSLADYRKKVAWMEVEEVESDEEEKEEEEDRTVCRRFILDPLLMVFDVSLLKSPTFVIYGLSCFLCMLGFFVPFIYLPTLCMDMGVDSTKAAFLISIIGIANTVGRVAVGFISDQPWADCLMINNVALVLGGAVTCCVPFLNVYALFAAYTYLFGTAIAIFVSLRSIIMVELMGLQKLTNAFGLVIMCQGISSFIGAPIAGFLSDVTGDYSISFYAAGAFMVLAGLICFPLRRVALWEAKREQAKKGKQLFDDTEVTLMVDSLS